VVRSLKVINSVAVRQIAYAFHSNYMCLSSTVFEISELTYLSKVATFLTPRVGLFPAFSSQFDQDQRPKTITSPYAVMRH